VETEAEAEAAQAVGVPVAEAAIKIFKEEPASIARGRTRMRKGK
jgi:hypothetical protein